MKKLMLAAIILACVSGSVFANDDAVIVSEPLAVATPGGACPPPAPVCAPEPKACATAPAEEIYTLVPVKKKVYETESYTVEETQSRVEKEVHTKIVKGNSPRLVRSAKRDGYPVLRVHEDLPKEVEYTKNVRVEYTVPVIKTRKVAKEVEEYQLVPERRRSRR